MSLEENLKAIWKKAFEDGYKQGIETFKQNFEIGRLMEKEDIARRMIGMEMDTQVIVAATGLSEEKVGQLREVRFLDKKS
ncbi:hypothetical protein [Paenibacillus contaminans]|uniref:Uncharacterized protein n=1 Tax=Paenibacillus contaminans TaxID=450362 RepID=A0A329MDH5_9BACL|nr:hypothetical protein [Paenibacillus contaminans]RAV17880.1 hypothetical protein DQG23_26080 [Paenibacillus contaminans]